MHRPIRVTAPSDVPVTLEDAKDHLRVSHDDENTFITSLIAAATSHIDGYTGLLGRCIITQTWKQDFDDWGIVMRLPFPDISSVALTYFGDDDEAQTVSASLYTLLEDARGHYIRFEDEFTSPSIGPDYAGITATFDSGFGDADATPAAIKAAILLHVGDLYMQRETFAENFKPTMAYEALVAPYRRVF